MAEQAEACELLYLFKENLSAALRRVESRKGVIRIERDNCPFYPLFQFKLEAGRIYPVLAEINRLLPDSWSNIRLCYWMTRGHADFGQPPAALLVKADDEILDAFKRAFEPEIHG